MFALEWTGRNHDRDGSAEALAIEAAVAYCESVGITNAATSHAFSTLEDDDSQILWGNIEAEAFGAAFGDWVEWPNNVMLIWN